MMKGVLLVLLLAAAGQASAEQRPIKDNQGRTIGVVDTHNGKSTVRTPGGHTVGVTDHETGKAQTPGGKTIPEYEVPQRLLKKP